MCFLIVFTVQHHFPGCNVGIIVYELLLLVEHLPCGFIPVSDVVSNVVCSVVCNVVCSVVHVCSVVDECVCSAGYVDSIPNLHHPQIHQSYL